MQEFREDKNDVTVRHRDCVLDGVQALPEDLRRKVGAFRVETYQSLAHCADCDAVLLYLDGREQMRLHLDFFMKGGVRSCTACRDRRRGLLAAEAPLYWDSLNGKSRGSMRLASQFGSAHLWPGGLAELAYTGCQLPGASR